MAGIGLIGAALAGAAQGGGDAAQKSLASMQDTQQKQDLVKLQVQLEEQKDLRIAAVNQDYHVANTATDFANQKEAAATQRTFDAEEKGFDRAARSGDIAATNASSERVAGTEAKARTDAAVIEASKLTMFQDANGGFHLFDQHSGESKPVTDKLGNPTIGLKNVPEAVLKEASAHFAAAAANYTLNPELAAHEQATGHELLQPYLPVTPPKPVDLSKFPKKALEDLQAGANNPQVISNFDQSLQGTGLGGPGTGRQILAQLQQAQPPLTGSASTSGAVTTGPNGQPTAAQVAAANQPGVQPLPGQAVTTQGTPATAQAKPGLINSHFVARNPGAPAAAAGAAPNPTWNALAAGADQAVGDAGARLNASVSNPGPGKFVPRTATGAPGYSGGNQY